MISIGTGLLNRKFTKDVVYNTIGIGISGVSGVIINIVIGKFYNAEGLGVYSQAFVWYMIFSIVTVFGINASLVKHIAEYRARQLSLDSLITCAIIAVGIISCATSALLYFFLPFFFENSAVPHVLKKMLIALPFLSLNRIMFGILNGLRYMQILAVAQSLRWLLIFGAFFILIFLRQPIEAVGYSFLFAELTLAVWLLAYTKKFYRWSLFRYLYWINTHLDFGSKAILSRSIGELNRYADILMIAYFLSDKSVGIYTFAASLLKGLLQLSNVIQMNFNPIISNLWAKNNIVDLQKYISKINKGTCFLMIFATLAISIMFPLLVYYIMANEAYSESIPVFYILLLGSFGKSIFPYARSFFAMTGFPGFNVKIILNVLFLNIILNILFVPVLGIQGAAIATSCSDMLLIFLYCYLIRKKLNINILEY